MHDLIRWCLAPVEAPRALFWILVAWLLASSFTLGGTARRLDRLTAQMQDHLRATGRYRSRQGPAK